MRWYGKKDGFTLVEMLITVVLSTLVSVMIYTVFISQTQAFRAQADMGSMQQNLRVGMEMLTRDIASAGFGTGHDGGSWGDSGQSGTSSNPVYALNVRENLGGAGPDAVEVFMMDPNRSTWALTDMNVRQACGTSSITFHADYPTAAAQYAATGSRNRIMCFAPSVRGRPASFIWAVNGVGSGQTVPVNSNSQADYLAECPNNLPAMMICGPPVYVAYYIDKNDADGKGIGGPALPVLYYVPDLFAANLAGGYPTVDDIPVALGIEDLQVQVCEPGLGTDCDLASSWSFEHDLSPSSVLWHNLGAVRVMLTARTIRQDENRSSVSTPIDLDSTDTYSVAATADGFHRRVARTEVAIRNAMGTWQVTKGNW